MNKCVDINLLSHFWLFVANRASCGICGLPDARTI